MSDEANPEIPGMIQGLHGRGLPIGTMSAFEEAFPLPEEASRRDRVVLASQFPPATLDLLLSLLNWQNAIFATGGALAMAFGKKFMEKAAEATWDGIARRFKGAADADAEVKPSADQFVVALRSAEAAAGRSVELNVGIPYDAIQSQVTVQLSDPDDEVVRDRYAMYAAMAPSIDRAARGVINQYRVSYGMSANFLEDGFALRWIARGTAQSTEQEFDADGVPRGTPQQVSSLRFESEDELRRRIGNSLEARLRDAYANRASETSVKSESK